MAHATINGRLGKDPELKTSQSGKEYARMSVAWQERQKDRTGEYFDGPTVWVSVTAFGRQAGNLVSSLHKGDHVTVTGRLQPELWSSDRGEETVLTMTADSVAPTLFFQQAQVNKDDQQSGGGNGFGGQRSSGPRTVQQNQQAAQGYTGQNDPWNSAPPQQQGGFSMDEDTPF